MKLFHLLYPDKIVKVKGDRKEVNKQPNYGRKQKMRKPIHSILFVLFISFCFLPFLNWTHRARAANPSTISFQGKVVNSNGTNVSDGTYSFVFRIYNTSSPTMTTSCTSTSSCLWQETQGSVTVTSGVFQVELGSACALTSGSCNNTAGGPINFANNNSLYLTMQFNGDSSGSNGGYMSPLIHITSVPFALQSDNSSNLGGIAAANYVQLNPSSQQSGGIDLSGKVTTPHLGVETIGDPLDIGTTYAGLITLGNIANGSFLFQSDTSATAYQFQNASNKDLLAIDTSGNQIALGTAGPSGVDGTILFNNFAGSGTAAITLAGNPSTNYTYQLPTGTVGSNQCLQSGTVSGGTVPLSFGTCSTLSSAYDSGGTSGNTISLSSSGGGIIIKDGSPSAGIAFQVQNGSSYNVLNIDASSGLAALGDSNLAGTLELYNGGNAVTIQAGASTAGYNFILPASSGLNNQCLVNTSTAGTLQWLPCGAGNTAKVVITPEFVGAVMTPVSLTGWTNSGTMTSDFCSGSSRQNINTPICTGSTESHNYYSWTAGNNCVNYDIWVRWSVPNDFSSFPSTNNSFYGWKTGSSTTCNGASGDDDVKLNVYQDSSAGACATQSMTNTGGSWQNTTIDMSGCSPNPGDVLTFDVQLKVNTSGDYARIGEITLDYNRL